jgi:hypothetical protein
MQISTNPTQLSVANVVLSLDFVVFLPPKVFDPLLRVVFKELQMIRKIFNGFVIVDIDVAFWWHKTTQLS